MKKIFRLSKHLAEVHSRRYRGLFHLEGKFPLRVVQANDIGNLFLNHRQPYTFMRRHPDGVSRKIFVFIKTLREKVKTDAGSLLRWEDDGGGVQETNIAP